MNHADEFVLDLFAGPGGWDTGLRAAGYTGALVGIELDMSACRTAVAAGHARIRADVATYPTGPLTGRVAGIVGSPPCQAWSTAGGRRGERDRPAVHGRIQAFAHGREPAAVRWADERSALAAEPMRWIHALCPRWVALEQVPPVLPLWEHMADLMRGMGYRVWTGILSAEEHGVPQTRKRAILIARRDGQPVGAPAPTHQPFRSGVAYETERSLFGDPLPTPVSMAQALGWGLPDQPGPVVMTARGRQAGPEDALRGSSWRHDWFHRQIADGNWIMRSNYGTSGDPADRGERDASEPAPTVTGKVNRNMWVIESASRRKVNDRTQPRTADDPAMTVAFGHSDMRWVMRNGNQANACACARALDEPAATTVVGDRRVSTPGRHDTGERRHNGPESVRVTVAEAGVLQSFPADYPWRGTKSAQYRQVGDAIPVLLAAAVVHQFIAPARREREP